MNLDQLLKDLETIDEEMDDFPKKCRELVHTWMERIYAQKEKNTVELTTNSEATVIRRHFLSMQVCVPSSWTDEQVIEFSNRENPAGTTLGWQIRREGDVLLAGAPERVVCTKDKNNVHIMLDC